MVVLNALSFCLSVEILISPSYLNEILAGSSNLGCRFFSFITLLPFLSGLKSFYRKISYYPYGDPLVCCCFSLAALNIWSLCLIFISLINMCLGVFCLGFILFGTLVLLDLDGYFLPHFREVFNYYLLKYFLTPFLFVFFWDSYDSNVGAFNVFPEVSEVVLISFNSFLFFPLCFIYFHHSIFHLTYPIFCLSYSTADSLQSAFDLIYCIIRY